MAKPQDAPPPSSPAPSSSGDNKLRLHAEQEFAAELAALAEVDNKQRPPRWNLSPWAVKTYILGGKLESGFEITPKYIGNERLIEIAIATLATDRALLLFGLPGTAKSWVSEHLSAAISGTSSLLIQGTAGTDESAIRYGWNYARLLAEGPSRNALVESPMLRAMETGRICRVEELTRISGEVQDALITILSEKTLPVPELNVEVQAVKGFNVIATANNRDKGVNELSSALLRRFNTVVLPVPDSLEDEVTIVNQRSAQLGARSNCPRKSPPSKRFAAWSRFSASCAAASPKTARPSSNRPAARFRRRRPSRWSPAAWPSRPSTATAASAPATLSRA